LSDVTSDEYVTIVLCAYDQAPFVEEAARSALAQTVPCRVVGVDDGSRDGSADIVESLGIPVLRLPHRGAVTAFRAGADLVETPYFLKLDGDDRLEPKFVEHTLPEMRDPHVGFVYTAARYFGAQIGATHPPAFDRRRLLRGNYAHGSSLIRREAYQSVGGYSPSFERTLEDWALWVDMVAAGWRGRLVDEPLFWYRIHPEISRNTRSIRETRAVRWRLWRRHPRTYGVVGLSTLVASELLYPLRMLGLWRGI